MSNMLKEAINVIKKNDRGGFTIPTNRLYPHQWNWDSGFIAIGLAHINIELAKKELESLLDAQWENGFVPHIVFHNDSDSYFPGPDFHLSNGVCHVPVTINLAKIHGADNGTKAGF